MLLFISLGRVPFKHEIINLVPLHCVKVDKDKKKSKEGIL